MTATEVHARLRGVIGGDADRRLAADSLAGIDAADLNRAIARWTWERREGLYPAAPTAADLRSRTASSPAHDLLIEAGAWVVEADRTLHNEYGGSEYEPDPLIAKIAAALEAAP